MQKLLVTSLVSFVATVTGVSWAHHGWSYFDTRTPYYLEGTIQEVRWQNPHVEVVLDVPESVELPEGFSNMAFPQELVDLGFREQLGDLAAPENAAGTWTLVLAPISRLTRWGMSEAPQVSQILRAVGFVSCEEEHEFRPQLTVLEDGSMARHQSVALPPGCSR